MFCRQLQLFAVKTPPALLWPRRSLSTQSATNYTSNRDSQCVASFAGNLNVAIGAAWMAHSAKRGLRPRKAPAASRGAAHAPRNGGRVPNGKNAANAANAATDALNPSRAAARNAPGNNALMAETKENTGKCDTAAVPAQPGRQAQAQAQAQARRRPLFCRSIPISCSNNIKLQGPRRKRPAKRPARLPERVLSPPSLRHAPSWVVPAGRGGPRSEPPTHRGLLNFTFSTRVHL